VIYICIPVYNEERTIGVVLWKLRQVMGELDRDYEVLVIDDGSTDGTADVMEPYARIMPVHLSRHDRREGYASSLEALIREAVERSDYPKRDVVVTLQADFTDEPEDVAQLVKRVEGGADVVTGRVRLVPAETPRMIRWSRRAWHQVLRRVRGGDRDGDMLSGFRAYRVMVLRNALGDVGDAPLLTSDGWAANAELMRHVLPHARRTEAVDVQVRYGRLQRESRFRPGQTSRELLRLLRTRAPARAAPRPAEAASGTGISDDPDRPDRGRRAGRTGGRRGGRDGRAGAVETG
jgi:glycosyltransferase involved in cell wall biosynthesis